MRKKDVSRKWLWWFLAVLAISQLYWVRELLAAFALFVLLFAALGSVIAAIYLMQKAWEAGVVRLAASQNRWVLAARRGAANLEELARRPLRRPGSEPTRA
jgi:apolipoprotein N-acyltransferase